MAAIMLPLSYTAIGIIVIICMAVVALLVWLYSYYTDIKDNYPELAVHKEAKHKPHYPIIDFMDASGRHRVFVGRKDKPQSPTFKNKESGLIFDPRMHSQIPADQLQDGTQMFTYCSTFHFPIDHFGAVAVGQVMENIHQEFPELDFIKDDFTVMGLLETSGDDLSHDIKAIMNIYEQDDTAEQLTESDVCTRIDTIKSRMKDWGVRSGFYNLASCVAKIPVGLTSTDLQRAIALAKIEAQNDMKNDNMNQYLPLYIVGGLIAIIVVVYMVTK